MAVMIVSCSGSVYLDIGRHRLKRNDYEGAKRYLEKAMTSFERDGDIEGVVLSLLHLTEVNIAMRNMQEAEECSKKALNIAMDHKITHYIPYCYNSLGIAKLISGSDKTKGVHYLVKSLEHLIAEK